MTNLVNVGGQAGAAARGAYARGAELFDLATRRYRSGLNPQLNVLMPKTCSSSARAQDAALAADTRVRARCAADGAGRRLRRRNRTEFHDQIRTMSHEARSNPPQPRAQEHRRRCLTILGIVVVVGAGALRPLLAALCAPFRKHRRCLCRGQYRGGHQPRERHGAGAACRQHPDGEARPAADRDGSRHRQRRICRRRKPIWRARCAASRADFSSVDTGARS